MIDWASKSALTKKWFNKYKAIINQNIDSHFDNITEEISKPFHYKKFSHLIGMETTVNKHLNPFPFKTETNESNHPANTAREMTSIQQSHMSSKNLTKSTTFIWNMIPFTQA